MKKNMLRNQELEAFYNTEFEDIYLSDYQSLSSKSLKHSGPSRDYDQFSESFDRDCQGPECYERLSENASKRRPVRNRLWDEMDHSEEEVFRAVNNDLDELKDSIKKLHELVF